jgi:hypothetical protein
MTTKDERDWLRYLEKITAPETHHDDPIEPSYESTSAPLRSTIADLLQQKEASVKTR